MKHVYDLTIREGKKVVSDRGKGRDACKKKALRQGFTKLVQGPGGGWPSVTGGSGMWVMGEEVGKIGRRGARLRSWVLFSRHWKPWKVFELGRDII